MRQVVEASWDSLCKHGEELCGDSVRITTTLDSFIAVLSDGLGSGVKANILSTLTSQIAVTMFQQGARIEDVMSTLAETLPECQTRHLAYATYAMLKVHRGREAYLVEYDSPELVLVRQGEVLPVPYVQREVNGRRVREASFETQQGDYLVMTSDGYEHAGVGAAYRLGWGHDRISQTIQRLCREGCDTETLTQALREACLALYHGEPGDDATVVAMRVRPSVEATIWSGPPADPALDAVATRKLMAATGLKVICGGTTAQIAARELGRELVVEWKPPSQRKGLSSERRASPPIARLEGVDLVTEGILTLGQTVELLRRTRSSRELPEDDEDAPIRLARLLLMADEIHLLVGTALNPKQVADLVRGQPMRHLYVNELVRELESRKKQVTVEYI